MSGAMAGMMAMQSISSLGMMAMQGYSMYANSQRSQAMREDLAGGGSIGGGGGGGGDSLEIEREKTFREFLNRPDATSVVAF